MKRTSEVIANAQLAIEAIVTADVGVTGTPQSIAVSRLLWVSAYDDYVNGATEVYVSLALPEEVFATHLDIFWIHWKSWDPLKSELIDTGRFHYGAEHFAPQVYARYMAEDGTGGRCLGWGLRTAPRHLGQTSR